MILHYSTLLYYTVEKIYHTMMRQKLSGYSTWQQKAIVLLRNTIWALFLNMAFLVICKILGKQNHGI